MRISDWSSDVCSSDLEQSQPVIAATFDCFEQPFRVRDERCVHDCGPWQTVEHLVQRSVSISGSVISNMHEVKFVARNFRLNGQIIASAISPLEFVTGSIIYRRGQ